MLRPVYARAPSAAPWPREPIATPARPPAMEADDAGARLVVAFLFGAALLARLCLTDPLLNSVINYTDEGGSLPEKIHPATYASILLLLFSLLRFRIEITAWEGRIIRQFLILIGVILALSIGLQIVGRSVSMGYLLETYIGACLTGVMMLTLRPAHRAAIGHMVICFIAVNATLAILEKAAGQRLLPYPYEEDTFRPTALSSHPLAMGLMHVGAVLFVLATRWNFIIKAGLVMLVVLGTFAAGARTASIMVSLTAGAGLMLTPMPAASLAGRFRLKAIILLAMLVVAPVVLLVADEAGFFERFKGGYFDENGQARIDVYQVFDWVSREEILFGADLIMIKKMVFDRLGLLIESSVVVFVFQFGLFGAILLAGTIIWTLAKPAIGREPRAIIAVGAFFATASSNDALSGKHALYMMMIVLLLAFRREALDARGRPITLGWGDSR